MLRKKWISLLVAISMVAAMFPATVFADTVEATEPVEPQTSVTETAQDEKDPVEEVGQPEVVNNENTATGEADKGTNESEEDETVVEETKKETETPADETEEKTEDVEKPASEEADPDEETTVVPPVTTPEVTENPVAGNSAVDTQALTGGDKTDDGINTEEELRAALVEGADVTLTGDIQLTSMLSIAANNVTLNLGEHTITAADDFRSTYENDKHLVNITGDNVIIENGILATTTANKHVVNVYGAKNFVLQDVTLDHTSAEKGAPLVINGGASADDSASVTLAGKVTFVTGEKSWDYSVNMEKKDGSAVSLTMADNADVTFGNKTTGIYVQGADASLTFGNGIKVVGGCKNPLVMLSSDTQVTGLDNIGIDPATVGMTARVGNTDYQDINDAIAALETATSDCTLTLYKDVKLDRHINVPAVNVTIEGKGNTIELPAGQDDKAFTNSSTVPEGLLAGTNLTVNNVKFTGQSAGVGHAVVVSGQGGVNVALNGCTFTNLYDAVYGNPVTDTSAKDTYITIKNSTFGEGVTHSYSVDNGATDGALMNKHQFVLEENVGEPSAETFAIAQYNGVGYDSLQDAVTAAANASLETGEKQEVSLHADITVSEPIQIPAGAKIRFYGNGYGNGHTITLDTEKDAGLALFSEDASVEGLKKDTTLELWSVNVQGNADTPAGYGVIVGAQGGVDLELHMCDFKNLYTAVYCQAVTDKDAAKNTINIEYSNFENLTHFYSVDNGSTSGAYADKHDIMLTENYLTYVGEPETWAVAMVNGKGYQSFAEAIAAAKPNEIVQLLDNVQLDSKLAINTEGLQLDLNGKTISASDSFNTKGHLVEVVANGVTIANGTIKGNEYVDHALHIWNADNVTLGKNLVLDNSATTVGGAPLVIGASNVTLEGNTTFVTGEKSWYGANVDSSIVSGTKEGSSLTVEGNIVFQGPNMNNAGIWVEDSKNGAPANVTVSFKEGSSAQGNGVDGFEIVHIVKGQDGNQQGTVTGGENAGLVTDENGNYIVKPAPVEETPSHEHSYVWQGSPDEHWQYCTDCGQVVSNGAHTFQWKDGVQVCSVCGYKVTKTAAASAPASSAKTAAAAPAAGTAAAAVATGIPQTGDESNPLLWVVLLAVSGSALGGMVIYKKKKEN